MVSIPGLSRSEEKPAPKKGILEQIESADVAALVAKTEKEIEDAKGAIARIEARIMKLQARRKYLEGVREMQEAHLEGEEASA